MSGSIGMGMPAGVPGGGLPPAMRSPAANLGPVTVPQSNPGNVMQAVQKLAAAHKMILEALPALPLGTPLHESVSKVATDLGKHLTKAGEDARMTIQTLMQAMRQHRQEAPQQALSQMMPPQPNAPPAMPPPSPMPAPGAAG